MPKELKLFTGNANPALAKEICRYLGIRLGEATVDSFSDGELRVKIDENVRGADVFLVQSCCPPVNDSMMELLIMLDALKRSSANRITAVMPYFGYARQDRKISFASAGFAQGGPTSLPGSCGPVREGRSVLGGGHSPDGERFRRGAYPHGRQPSTTQGTHAPLPIAFHGLRERNLEHYRKDSLIVN